MVSKNIQKLVRSLELKKNRRREGLFVAEGPKVVGDLMRRYRPTHLIATREWLDLNGDASVDGCLTVEATDEELRRTSFLQHPQQVIGVFPLPAEQTLPTAETFSCELCLALDGVQDPGNVGTILRVADWFGIHTVVCSHETADVFSPKVVQATMGSIARMNVSYADLPTLLSSLPADVPVYGTLLDGNNIYEETLTKNGIIVMGNEGNGLSEAVRQRVTKRLLIPSYGNERSAESLNVAIATAIVCAEFRRVAAILNYPI